MTYDIHLVDTHCHLTFPGLREDLDNIIVRAKSAHIVSMMSIGTALEEIPVLHQLVAKSFDGVNIYGTVGIHPHEAEVACKKHTLAQIHTLLIQGLVPPKILGLGETGLDYYHANAPQAVQKKVFQAHLDIAAETHTPLVIHTRCAEKETIDLLSAYKGCIQGVFHCFSGSLWLAKQALDLGFYLSASGIVTFKNAQDVRDIFKTVVPIDRLLVETDAPYLAPVPYRGKRCEPAFVKEIATFLAQLKNISLEELSYKTTQNFLTLFQKNG